MGKGLPGFDPEFRDLPHYVYSITARIWEGRRPDLVREYYSKDCPVRSPSGLVAGAEEVVAATVATMAEFPDRRLLGDDVIWKKEKAGLLSSHRLLSTATHDGDGAYGEATGNRVSYYVIADCLCRKNQVVEEWLVRDQGAIARCLGMEPRELARRQVDSGDAGAYCSASEKGDKSAYEPKFPDDPEAEALEGLFRDVWERQDFASAAARHDHAAVLHGPGGVDWFGREGASRFFLSYAAAVRRPRLKIRDVTVGGSRPGKSVAMRWTVEGECSSAGALTGGTAGRDVYVMGISHARFSDGLLVEHWCLLDEVALWKQVLPRDG